jgi:RHS repeat-associated protein
MFGVATASKARCGNNGLRLLWTRPTAARHFHAGLRRPRGPATSTVASGTGDMYTALASLDGVLTVFEHYDATLVSGPVHTAGTWEYAPSYSSGTGLTTFTSGTSVFEDHYVGWFLQPDGRSASYFPIVDVTSTTLVVAGNLSTLAGIGDVYFIVPPVGVDRDTGTFNGLKGGFFGGDQNLTRGTFIRNLAWGYRYIPPAAGILDSSTIHGRQPGNNLAGQYTVWHRVYDPVQGRWTTPDPAATPWSNLVSYCYASPATVSDPSGLWVGIGEYLAYLRWRAKWLRKLKEEWGGAEPEDRDGTQREARARMSSRGNCLRYALNEPIDPVPPEPGPNATKEENDEWVGALRTWQSQHNPGVRGFDGSTQSLRDALTRVLGAPVGKDDECPPPKVKIAAFHSEALPTHIPPASADIHFYRQGPDGTWTHKSGDGAVTDRDNGPDGGQIITNPETCKKDYGVSVGRDGRATNRNYSEFAGYYCVPN